MAFVLPQGNFNNTNTKYIRTWVMNKARVSGVVGIHGNTFKPFTGTKTSILFLRKWAEGEEIMDDHPIFLAVNEQPVKKTKGTASSKRTLMVPLLRILKASESSTMTWTRSRRAS